MLFRGLTHPWTDVSDFNGAVWSQSAHNTLRAGLWATKGVPSGFYFGPLPIPKNGYYTHHPPLLSLSLAGIFAVVGEHEWAARLLPALASLASTGLLFALVNAGAGPRAGALATAVFVALPMEMRFGTMVNFEPLALAGMLATLFVLHRWEQTRLRIWWRLLVGAVALLFWTAWLGGAFLLVLCFHYIATARKREPQLVLLLVLVSSVSFLLFLAQYWLARPDFLPDLARAFRFRVDGPLRSGTPTGPAVTRITWSMWFPYIRQRLADLFQPLAWCLAGLGAAVVLRRGRAQKGFWWLGWAALCIFILNLLYLVAFRNASYIHDYASFYFLAPVALMGGVGCDAVLGWSERNGWVARTVGALAVCSVLLALAVTGERIASKQERQLNILGDSRYEQPALIPQLGVLIRASFARGTTVFANCYPSFFPGLAYYAQRVVIGGLESGAKWSRRLGKEDGRVGGVIWVGDKGAKDLVKELPPGVLEPRVVAGERFLLWRPK